MPSLINCGVQKISGVNKVFGDVLDDDGNVIATFGPTGTNYAQWFNGLSADEQSEIINKLLPSYMVPWLLRQVGL
jgi:phage-related protein